MGVRVGYYGDHRAELLDGVAQVCTLLGATVFLVPPTPIQTVDVLLWNHSPPLDEATYVQIRIHPNLILLPERRRLKKWYTGVFPSRVLTDVFCVVPFDPEELAIQIILASWKRRQWLAYDFDPVFAANHHRIIEKYWMPPPD